MVCVCVCVCVGGGGGGGGGDKGGMSLLVGRPNTTVYCEDPTVKLPDL